jgi:nucleotide-binding universal stress UspA family protein
LLHEREFARHRFLLGSVTAKVLHESECSVWTGAHLEGQPATELDVRTIICAVDLTNHSRYTLSYASQLATKFEARLVVAHITTAVEIYGPGGFHVVPEFKEAVVGFARQEMDKLLQETGTKAEVIIKSGEATTLLTQAAEETKADVLVIGHTPLRGHLGANGNGYAIIRSSRIPVFSV